MHHSTVRTRCKINLFLEITGTRADGYHELVTLFYPVSEPHDTLTLTPGPPGSGLAFACSIAGLDGPDNLAVKAYRAFAQTTGFAPDLDIRLEKGVPSGAGLGGGSADAAAVLRHLNTHAGQQALTETALAALAARLGADVPFFLGDGPAWATGIGDRLKPADPGLRGTHALIAMGAERVSTSWAYKRWDSLAASPTNRNPCLTMAQPTATEPFCVSGMVIANSFEAVVFPACPGVRALKERLLGLGAAAAAMSGSGAAVFGLFRDQAAAESGALALAADGLDVWASVL